MKKLLCCLLLVVAPAPALAMQCAPFIPDPLAGFTALDAGQYMDLPDGDTVRATSAIETSLVNDIITGQIGSFTKTWCQIGVQRMIVDFAVPVEDDAIRAIVTRAIYVWDASFEPAGWRMDQLAERGICARGDDPFAPLCP